jgi:hypothetical protein
MKTITCSAKLAAALKDPSTSGLAVVECVVVDWFPHLTADQVLANALARDSGQPEIYPDPNFIEIRIPNPRGF